MWIILITQTLRLQPILVFLFRLGNAVIIQYLSQVSPFPINTVSWRAQHHYTYPLRSLLCMYCLHIQFSLSLPPNKLTQSLNVDVNTPRCNYFIGFCGFLFIMPHNTPLFERVDRWSFLSRLTVAFPWCHVPVCRLNDKSIFYPTQYWHKMVFHARRVDCVCWERIWWLRILAQEVISFLISHSL